MHHQLHAFGVQRARDRRAQAMRAASDQRHFSRQRIFRHEVRYDVGRYLYILAYPTFRTMSERTNGASFPADWPAPEARALARSHALTDQIRREINAGGGSMPFARYMALALYAPALGYYSNDEPKFGEGGDFITAPELSPLFARCLANQVAQILETLGDADVLEAGAGSGVLAAQMLLALERLGHPPRR